MHCHIYYKLANNVLTFVTAITHPDSDANDNDYQDYETNARKDETNYPP